MPMTAQDIAPALVLWPQLLGGRAALLNHSENHTFRVDCSAGRSFMLRVHRTGYQSGQSIDSELAWLLALRADTAIPVPQPIAGGDGRLLQAFRGPDGTDHLAVLFDYIAGDEPTLEGNLVGLFGTLGRYAATLHRHAASWQRPAGFARRSWQASTILDADGPWGDWRLAPGVNAYNRPILDRLDATLWMRLAEYGLDPARYGLIHADMRLGNLLVDGDVVSLIDFDDCGFCWFTYDFAAAISFHETHPLVPALKAAWLAQYQAVRPLDGMDIGSINAMVMLRRMSLLAWIGSHAETGLAQQHAPGFADGTADLAERYLRGTLWLD